jgi:lysozyme family protein
VANFDLAVAVIFQHEGGYSNNPADPGGETNYGISKRIYPTLDIKNLTQVEAQAILLRDYWKFSNVLNQDVANKLLDMSVNLGQGTAIKIAQHALNQPADGLWGPSTEHAVNNTPPATLLNELRARAAARHSLICIAEPKQATFLLGWLRRDCS